MPGTSPKSLRAENERLSSEIEELRLRLEEAEQALEAIRTGQVESLVVDGPDGPRIFSLEGADHSYRVLVEAMNEGAATLGEDGTILYCNTRFAQMLEAPLERVMGSEVLRFLPGRSREAFDAMVREANGGESRGELALITQDGQEVPAYLSVSAIHDGDRRRFCLVAADLRAQKRNEEIVAAEQLARSVLEQAADAVVVCDRNGRIIRASDSAAELCAGNPLLAPFEEVLPLALSTADGVSPRVSLPARAMRGEVLRAVPASLHRGHGPSADLLVSAKGLHGSSGHTIGCVVTLVDVTEHRRAEAALREADRRKDRFLAVLSHELRNPLAPIRNSLFILDRAVPGGDQARRAQAIIDRQTGQLARLVDDLLDVTRITRDKIELQRQRLELNELVRRTMDDYLSLFEKKEVSLELIPAPAPVFVYADWNRLAQVIGNLLQNAAKFTARQGTTRVSVATDTAERCAVIRVADSGVGISPSMLARIFEPFSQADDTLDRGKGGLGLGLALVKGLVELHGGEVSARSDGAGKGAELVVRLPLAARATAQPPTRRSGAKRSGRRILIIEDNIDAADSLSEALEFGDHEVAVAYSGLEGLEKARELCPEIVLCDIGLPGMSGYEVARALSADDRLKGAFLVALSGYAMPEDLQRASEAGFQRHIAKPPRLDELERLLAEVPRRSADASPDAAPPPC